MPEKHNIVTYRHTTWTQNALNTPIYQHWESRAPMNSCLHRAISVHHECYHTTYSSLKNDECGVTEGYHIKLYP